MIEWVIEPLQYGFMVRALVGTTFIALMAALVGSFILLKGIAFIGDALAHASFAGLAVAVVAGWPLVLGALGASVLCAAGLSLVRRTTRLNYDAVLAILFTGAFAIGVVILATQSNFAGDLTALLLGSVMAVSGQDLLFIALVALGICALFYLLFDRLIFVAFDPVGAEASNLPVLRFDMIFMVLVALAIVVSIQAVGVILVVALLITPSATASLVSRKLPRIIALAAAGGVSAAWIGLYGSYYLSIPPGAAVVLMATAQFLVVYGIVTLGRARRNRSVVG